MTHSNQSTGSPPPKRDDLQKIKGIGQSVSQTLNSLGIFKYADIAAYSNVQLAELLKDKLVAYSPGRIEREDWIGQAKSLDRKDRAREEPQQPKQIKTDQASAPDESTNGEMEDQPGKWHELADFIVSFGYLVEQDGEERLQTRVYHSPIGTSRHWDGIQLQLMNDWMVSQADLPLLEKPTSRPEADLKTEKPRFSTIDSRASEVELKISDLWLSEAENKSPTKKGTPASRVLRLKTDLALVGNQTTELDFPSQFQLEIYVVDLESNESKLVAVETGELVPTDYAKRVEKDFDIPPTGRYQLYLIAKMLPPNTSTIYLQGPIIKVEPY